MRKVVTLSIFSVFLVACASTDTAEVSVEEPIQYIDLTLDNKKELIDDYWVVEKRQDAKYPISAAIKGLSGCVDLIVGIKNDGKSGGYKVKKSYPKGVFDKHAAAALTKWKWVPADKNGDSVPVLTTIQFDFMAGGSINKKEAESQCGFSHDL
jgi:protein TonB